MKKLPRLLVIQRVSLSHGKLKSRSIGARFGPLLNYMLRHALLEWEMILESDINLADLSRFDAVLLNKHSSKKGVEIIQQAKRMGVKTIYDMDDWILDLPSYSVTNLEDDVLSNVIKMLKEADIVTVSTDQIKERLRFLRPDAFVLENGFDHEGLGYCHQARQENKKPKILFSNTDGIKLVSHRKLFFEQLIAFQHRHPEVQIDFWGDQFLEMTKIPRLYDRGFLNNLAYKAHIRDEGYWFAIVPLGGAEDEVTYRFNTCKSHIKFIDYSSLGIPGIYSNTPVYQQVVAHEVTGLVVDNKENEWAKAMEEMYTNHQLRRQISDSAYQYGIEHFGVEKIAHTFINLVCT